MSLSRRSLSEPIPKKSRVSKRFSVEMIFNYVPFETLEKTNSTKKSKIPIPFLSPETHASLNQFHISAQRIKDYIDENDRSELRIQPDLPVNL